jgi:hypothetical protein
VKQTDGIINRVDAPGSLADSPACRRGSASADAGC